MKKTLVLAIALAAVGAAIAQPSVSISINQPGIYGRVHIGDLPLPALVLPRPVIIAAPSYRVERSPIYLYVPSTHQHDWRRYCGRYNACEQPVYFVRDQWIRERYQERHRGKDHDKDDGKHHGKHHGKDDGKHHGKHHGKDDGKHHGKHHGKDRRD